MKNIIILVLIFTLALLVVSCEDKYEMPYNPGVNVDVESFNKHKELWNNSDVKNYSYTYKWKASYSPTACIIADVKVTDGKVDYVLKQLELHKESEITEDDKSYFEISIGSKENLLIENLYNEMQSDIESNYQSYSENPDCYYANFTFDFSDNLPFILRYKNESGLMKEDLGGGFGYIEIKIENFTEN